jgi:BirA family transcriptional regulator, biotin operon repressor / biotin---[acetyl-CoA-carboxylase] ligase
VKIEFGRPHRHFRRTDSTNARAKEVAGAGGPGGLVVTADEQTAGRGRQGRSWFAPPGSALLYSALLRPLGERPLLPLAVPLAVCEAAEAVAPVRCELKWPNDVWIEGRKLAGVLIEARPDEPAGGWAVIGAGVNVSVPPESFPAALAGTAVSLGGEVTVAATLAELNRALTRWVAADDAAVLAAFRERDALFGREVAWADRSGTAAGIDDAGHLLVDTGGGEPVRLGAGEVHLGGAQRPG